MIMSQFLLIHTIYLSSVMNVYPNFQDSLKSELVFVKFNTGDHSEIGLFLVINNETNFDCYLDNLTPILGHFALKRKNDSTETFEDISSEYLDNERFFPSYLPMRFRSQSDGWFEDLELLGQRQQSVTEFLEAVTESQDPDQHSMITRKLTSTVFIKRKSQYLSYISLNSISQESGTYRATFLYDIDQKPNSIRPLAMPKFPDQLDGYLRIDKIGITEIAFEIP